MLSLITTMTLVHGLLLGLGDFNTGDGFRQARSTRTWRPCHKQVGCRRAAVNQCRKRGAALALTPSNICPRPPSCGGKQWFDSEIRKHSRRVQKRTSESKDREQLYSGGGPVMTADVDFTSQTFFRDPAAGIERLRTLGPVVETRFPIVGKVWITTTYDSTARVLKDGETFTLRKEGGGVAGLRSPTAC
jgi:hypothetical protein